MISTPIMNPPHQAPSGARLISAQEGVLPLRGTSIQAEAGGGIAHVTLRQRFHNPHDLPLSVTYSLPVPEEAAIGGFLFTIGQRRILGEIDRRASARKRFEEAILEGRTAAVMEEERSSLFTQEIGNIPPGADVDVEVELDLRLRWLEEGAWELRIPTTVAPRYLGATDRVADATRITQDVTEGGDVARVSFACTIHDGFAKDGKPRSPSHAIGVDTRSEACAVSLSDEATSMDRDIVVQWPVAQPAVGVALSVAPPEDGGRLSHRAFGLLTVVPPEPHRTPEPIARDLIVLIDTSGSMSGEPLSHARRVVAALVDTLTERDTLELIQFSWTATRWQSKPTRMRPKNKAGAMKWLRGLRASGGTEMREGILAALTGLRADSQRQVVLVTDGLIGFEQEIVSEVLHSLPAGSRVHAVGVGSAVNRSLTGPVARAGRGVEVVVGIGEDPEPAAARIVARTASPVVVDLSLSGEALVGSAPAQLPDLFQGAPALIALELRPEGGTLTVRGTSSKGRWQQDVHVAAQATGQGSGAVARLYGRERIEDLETRRAAGEPSSAMDEAVEGLGLAFQIASKRTSWVAIDEEPSVDPGVPTRRERVPHQLPHAMSAEGLGLRAPMARGFGGGMAQAMMGMIPGAPPVAAAMPSFRAKAKKETSRVAEEREAAKPRSGSATIARRAVDALSDWIGGKADEGRAFSRPEAPAAMDECDDDLAVPPCERAEEPMAPSTLVGRVLLHDDKKIILEVTVRGGTLKWDPPEQGTLVLADGTRLTLGLGKGTRGWTLPDGAGIRIVLLLEGTNQSFDPAGTTLELDMPDGLLVIRLETL